MFYRKRIEELESQLASLRDYVSAVHAQTYKKPVYRPHDADMTGPNEITLESAIIALADHLGVVIEKNNVSAKTVKKK